ncbi:hypothetical protein [Streptomyces californicus]|uniref:hypothetical protein n=1 Tax=Streptomyces californicus TaxID=67351 RepID=UPI0033E90F6F
MHTDACLPATLGLSCYTENLTLYLAARSPDSADLVARSVRLAVDPATGAFSHHGQALNNLPGNRHLRYSSAPEQQSALAGISAELTARGQVLAVANSGSLPWLNGAADESAPHLLVIDGREHGTWHVTDAFTALFSNGGSQDPFAGTVSDQELADLLHFPHGLSPVHRTRNTLAFGFPVSPPPHEAYQWLVEEEGTTAEELPGGPWLTGAPALQETARLLVADLSAANSRGVLEDIWAAAQHHLFRHVRLLASAGAELSPTDRQTVAATMTKWREIPRMLRFAANSARRGRPRTSLITSTFTTLADLETSLSALHTAHGYGVHSTRPVELTHAQQGG